EKSIIYSDTKKIQCEYYFSEKGCRYEDKCCYSHDDLYALPKLFPCFRAVSKHAVSQYHVYDETYWTKDGFTYYETEALKAPVSIKSMITQFTDRRHNFYDVIEMVSERK